MDFRESKRTRWLICLGLAVATLAIYWRVLGYDFVAYDDTDYVTENPMVRAGLNFKGVFWALTHSYACNWHPLTWISLMLDCQIFGLHAGGFHFVNVAFHAANAALLFLLLDRISGARWRSAVAAALFALHPLHVESVAWISERKDVLSTFFALLSLLAYARFAEESKVQSRTSKIWFACALGLFALGLLAKPMLVTLPFVILLLDFWPMERLQNIGWRTFFTPAFGRLVREKWAWFALSAVSSAITYYAQKTGGAVLNTAYFPFTWRAENAIGSYFLYILKTCWPVHLAIFYPLDRERPTGLFLAAAGFLLIVSLASLALMKRRPYLPVGWFWFVGTLVPVLGFVQVGSQSMADRYTYLPSIGIFIAVVWWAGELIGGSKSKVIIGNFAVTIVLVALSIVTFVQTGYWKDSITLFGHAVEVTRDNDTALNNLGAALFHAHRYDEALACDEAAVRLLPGSALYQNDLGAALAAVNRQSEALAHYSEAVRLDPSSAHFQNNLATALARAGQEDAAIDHYQVAIRDDPKFAEPYSNLGALYVSRHRLDDALREYTEALRLDPENAVIHLNAGLLFAKAGHADEAQNQLAEAVRLDPVSGKARYEFGHELLLRGKIQPARDQLAEAVRLKPDDAHAQFYLGLACLESDSVRDGLNHLEQAARLRPDWVDPLNARAWVLATSADDKVRNGAESLRLAQRAAELSSHQPAILQTLAAAYAETGQFDQAMATANQAIQSAQSLGQTNLIPRIQQALELYRDHRPFRDTASGRN